VAHALRNREGALIDLTCGPARPVLQRVGLRALSSGCGRAPAGSTVRTATSNERLDDRGDRRITVSTSST
jgi:hypothetical protein